MKVAFRKAALLITTVTAVGLATLVGTSQAVSYGADSAPSTELSDASNAGVTEGKAAAGLEKVSNFGSNPGALSMFRYKPDGLPEGSPVVLALHGCNQDAQMYFDNAGWQKFADAGKFSVVAPQQELANNGLKCFNWFEPGDVGRDKGEALSIKQMVDKTIADLKADPKRVFITGLSAGGGMTSSMMASYPDVFAGGAVIAGLPHGCANSSAEAWTCMSPGVSKSAAQWGDIAKKAAPGHSGPRPKVSIWHGTADTKVVPKNATESVKQWTNVLGADQEADGTESLPGGTTRSDYKDGNGDVVVRNYSIEGMAHGTPVKPSEGCGKTGANFFDTICSSQYIAKDWGLGG
ncbi:PHB depolymerase family esterase [Streptomyces bathyalis]|uniref:PHB depolymerase family esterase n=1 Tax=Streptomyces bathyalis TaxID=2710756 RepID=A0A7T1WT85_9ACTN|nr:PHB depolymerase family esterase [Streptomyces bathyalis]QPP08334.1 PHB depolymerase family esterase [Streptomyces bathyalis]